jgi:predicted metalloendopeptidase
MSQTKKGNKTRRKKGNHTLKTGGIFKNDTLSNHISKLKKTYKYCGIQIINKYNPKDDFYSYINNEWIQKMEKTTLTGEGEGHLVQIDDFRIVQSRVFKQLIDISNEYIKDNDTPLSVELKNYLHALHLQLTTQQLKNYANEFVSFVDDMQKEETSLWKLVGTISYNEVISWALPFIFKMDPDVNNPTIYRMAIYPGTVTLYDYDVYFEEDFQDDPAKLKYIQHYKSTYHIYLNNIFEYIFGKNHRFNISYIFDVEQQIVKSSDCKLPRDKKKEQAKQEDFTYVKKGDALKMYGFDFAEYSKQLGFTSSPDFFITTDIKYLQCCCKMLNEDWRNEKWNTYFVYIFIKQLIRFNDNGSKIFADFTGKFMYGQEKKIHDKYAGLIYACYPFNSFFTEQYVNKYEDKKNLAYVQKLADELKNVFMHIVSKNTWLSPITKKYALLKLQRVKVVTSQPDTLREDPLLNYVGNDCWHNILKITKWRHENFVRLEGKHIIDIPDIDFTQTPPKLTGTQAYVVNASYTPITNSIYIPLGYIQKPFVDLEERGIAYNLAHVGFTIAHELSHALDDWGSQYDYNGKLFDWWNAKDKKEFSKIQKDVIDQYTFFAERDNIQFDAAPSVGEDLADISGLNICVAYLKGFQDLHEDNPHIRLLSYKAFFVYFAQQMRQKISSKALRTQLIVNPHPPDKYRTNIPLSRTPIFRTIYNIKRGDEMFWKNTNRIYE